MVVYALNVVKDINSKEEPATYSDAVRYDDFGKWIIAMQKEMESLHKNGTWDLVKLPKDKKDIHCK